MFLLSSTKKLLMAVLVSLFWGTTFILLNGAATMGAELEDPFVSKIAPWGLDRISQANGEELLDGFYDPVSTGCGSDVYVLSTGVDPKHKTTYFTRCPNVRNENLGTDIWFDGTMVSSSPSRRGTTTNIFDGFGSTEEIKWPPEGSPESGQNNDALGLGTFVAGLVSGSCIGVAPCANVYGMKVVDDKGVPSVEHLLTAGRRVVTLHNHKATGDGDGGGGSVKRRRKLQEQVEPETPFAGSVVIIAVPEQVTTPSTEELERIQQMVDELTGAGVVVVVPAGDSASDVLSPKAVTMSSRLGALKGVITVAASSGSDKPVASSNYGSAVDLFAPGDPDLLQSACSSLVCKGSEEAFTRGPSTVAAAAMTAGAITMTMSQLSLNAHPPGRRRTLATTTTAVATTVTDVTAITALLLDAAVKGVVDVSSVGTNTPSLLLQVAQTIPLDDPYTSKIAPWGLDRISQATSSSNGEELLDGFYDPVSTGCGSDVYVLSTGVDPKHKTTYFTRCPNVRNENLGTDIWFNGTTMVSPSPSRRGTTTNIFDGFGSTEEIKWPPEGSPESGQNNDALGLGTFVAGLVSGSCIGVAPCANVYGMKVVDDKGVPSVEHLLTAGRRVVTLHNHKAKGDGDGGGGSVKRRRKLQEQLEPETPFAGSVVIIAVPEQVTTPSTEELERIQQMVDELTAAGVVVVVPAGDSASDVLSPKAVTMSSRLGALKGVITVAASSGSDKPVASSNYGSAVDLFAPGDPDLLQSACSSLVCKGSEEAFTRGPSTVAAAAMTAGAITMTMSQLSLNAHPPGRRRTLATTTTAVATTATDVTAITALLLDAAVEGVVDVSSVGTNTPSLLLQVAQVVPSAEPTEAPTLVPTLAVGDDDDWSSSSSSSSSVATAGTRSSLRSASSVSSSSSSSSSVSSVSSVSSSSSGNSKKSNSSGGKKKGKGGKKRLR